MRFGVQPHVVAEARLGDMIEGLWECRPEPVSPLVVRVLIETMRFIRRAPNAVAFFGDDYADREAFDWQVSRLLALEPAFREYLQDAPQGLLECVGEAQGQHLSDILRALDDLHADTGQALLPLAQRGGEQQALAIEVMRWSRDPQAGRWLSTFANSSVPLVRRASHRPMPNPPRRPSLPAEIPYPRGVARAARTPVGGGGTGAAAGELRLGPDVPGRRIRQRGLVGTNPRQANPHQLACRPSRSQSGCAPGGPCRRCSSWRAGGLALVSPGHRGRSAPGIFDAVQVIASEGLTLLWPDVDRLAESDNLELALHAREATERLAEEMEDCSI